MGLQGVALPQDCHASLARPRDEIKGLR